MTRDEIEQHIARLHQLAVLVGVVPPRPVTGKNARPTVPVDFRATVTEIADIVRALWESGVAGEDSDEGTIRRLEDNTTDREHLQGIIRHVAREARGA